MDCTSYYNLSYADYEALTYDEYLALVISCLHWEIIIAATAVFQPGAAAAALYQPGANAATIFPAGAAAAQITAG
jgi:hypothetical protein